jgi:hypothetical protein
MKEDKTLRDDAQAPFYDFGGCRISMDCFGAH